MGLKQSKSIHEQLSDAELKALCLLTKMSKSEIIKWHKGFMLDCPSGRLTKEQFVKIYEQLFPSGRTRRFCDTVFKVFDKTNSNSIDFSEFILACSLTSRLKSKEKLEISYQLYDNSDSSSIISQDEMKKIIQAVLELYEGVSPNDKDSTQRVNLIVSKYDRNKSGSVTKADFLQGVSDDPAIKAALQRQESINSLKLN